MEIKEGMYARIDHHRTYIPINISKIQIIDDDKKTGYYCCITSDGELISVDNFIGKPSFSIVDVIEDGDYVNGMKVLTKREFKDLKWVIVDNLAEKSNDDSFFYNPDNYIYESEIKTIVTKEQFEYLSYKIEKDLMEGQNIEGRNKEKGLGRLLI